MKYDDLAELNKLQDKLSSADKQVVLLAVEKKFEIAQLSSAELEKVNALEKELSSAGREIVLVALSR